VIVRINDRGPFHDGRVIDLSYTAALKLGVLNAVAPVEVERITQEAIRTGAWRSGSEGRAMAAGPAPVPAVAATTSTPMVPPTVSAPEVPAGAITTVAIAPSSSAREATAADSSPALDDEVPPRAPPRSIAMAATGFWLQLGAFRERDGALDFQRKVERELDWLAPTLAVFNDRDLYRLQAGPYRTRTDAGGAADRVRAELQLVPLIVERR
jgi:rare lipoprotein A